MVKARPLLIGLFHKANPYRLDHNKVPFPPAAPPPLLDLGANEGLWYHSVHNKEVQERHSKRYMSRLSTVHRRLTPPPSTPSF